MNLAQAHRFTARTEQAIGKPPVLLLYASLLMERE
jgi:hypothetical protein